MVDGYAIDSSGFMLEPLVNLPDGTQNGAIIDGKTIVVTRCPDGYYKPQWNGSAWIDANAPTAAQQLASAKTSQKASLQQSFQKAIAGGFSSSATGTAVTYAIDPIAMGKWTGTLANINDGMLTANIMVKDISGNKVTLTPAQFKQMAMDGFNFFNAQEQNLWTKEDDVDAATTITAVQAVTY